MRIPSVITESIVDYILGQSPNMVAIHLPNGYYQEINQACLSFLGYEPTDLIGTNIYDIIHPDDVDLFYDKGHRPAINKKIKSLHYRMMTKAGTVKHVSSSIIPVKNQQGSVQYLVIITYSRQREKQLESRIDYNQKYINSIVEMLNIGYWEYNFNKDILHWSSKVYEIHELDSTKPISFENSVQYFVEENKTTVEHALHDAIQTGTPFDLKVSIRTALGTIKYVRYVGQLHIVKGKPQFLFGVIIDLTEDTKNEHDQLMSYIEKLKSQTDRLKSYSQIVSHDLRGPLTSISLLAREIENAATLDDISPLTTMLKESVDSLLGKVDFLAKLVDTSSENDLIEQINIDDVISRILSQYQGVLIESNLEIMQGHNDFDTINYPRLHLQSILSNAILNAALFADPKKNKKTLRIDRKLKKGKHIISFTDNGLGFPYNGKRIRQGQTYHSQLSREGRGLFLIQTLVESNDGEITIDSRVGVGTCLTIYLDKYKQQKPI